MSRNKWVATLLTQVPVENYHPHVACVSKQASYQDHVEHTQDKSSMWQSAAGEDIRA